MTDYDKLPANTPVLVGAGQVVEREVTAAAPMELAAEAARRAIGHAGGEGVIGAIDTIAITRLFTDSMGIPACPFGRSDNPPLSVARALGAKPRDCVYGQVGGTEPQGSVIEFARRIAAKECSVVLLAGAEATHNQRSAQREGRELDWNESFDAPLDDRGWGELFVTGQEVSNGMLAPMIYYALIDQARAAKAGRSTAQHREAMARMLAPFTAVAAANPYAQFPTELSARELLAAEPLNHLYSKRMVARDSVNQGAALLLCSVGAARQLGIPADNWVFAHGMAQGADFNLSEREDPSGSPVAAAVLDRSFAQAGITPDDIRLIDLYSCFPCAVSATAAVLGLPDDGSRALTVTGGLPYCGGPGNNYGMHALAEMVAQLRDRPRDYALVSSVGGVYSKHAAGIYSRVPAAANWAELDTGVSPDERLRRAIIEAPASGRIVTWVVNYQGGEPAQAMVLAQTDDGQRFVAATAPGDAVTVAAMLGAEPVGRRIVLAAPVKGALHFSLA